MYSIGANFGIVRLLCDFRFLALSTTRFVRFGSLADLFGKFSSMSAFGGKADVRDKRSAIRDEVVRRYSPVQHNLSIGFLVSVRP